MECVNSEANCEDWKDTLSYEVTTEIVDLDCDDQNQQKCISEPLLLSHLVKTGIEINQDYQEKLDTLRSLQIKVSSTFQITNLVLFICSNH